MKKFVISCLIFAIPILLLAYPIDFFLSTLLKKTHVKTGEFEVSEDIYLHKIKSDLIIIGSSRAWTHFDSEILEKELKNATYNLGIDGHKFRLQLLRYQEFIKHNPAPKEIILSIEATSFEKRNVLYKGEQFLPYMLNNDSIQKYLKTYDGFENSDFKIPLIRYIGQDQVTRIILMNLIQNLQGKGNYRIKGYRGQDKTWNNDFEKAKKENPDYVIEIDREVISIFCDFIASCKAKNIAVYMVYSPEYIEGQNYVINRAKMMTIFDSIANQYEIPLIDYSNHPISFDKQYFYNASHMNITGAKLFSQDLGKKLLKINDSLVN
jgi:hypothetical protein